MMRSLIATLCLFFLFQAVPAKSLKACDACRAGHAAKCQSCGGNCCHSRLVTKTVMVPIVVTETRMKTCYEHDIEQREETYTVFKRVPRTQKYSKEVCYLEDQVKSAKIKKKECRRVMNPVVQTYKVHVPQTEVRYVDPGCGCQNECTCGANGNGSGSGAVCPVEVTTMRTEIRTRNRMEPQVVFEETEKEFFYCVKEPKKRTEVCGEETIYDLVPVKKKRMVDVCVPRIVKRPVEVQVKKMIQKTVYCCQKCK